MNPRIVVDPAGRRDLLNIYVFLSLVSPSVADRFTAAADKTIQSLSRMSTMGRPCRFRVRRLAGLRQHAVRGFRKYLIYYRPLPDGIEVLRVIHGARNTRRVIERGED